MSIKLSVSEMSKIVGISSRNLRYYDSIGLFKPSGYYDNGYRFYTIDKIEEIHLINYLRHVGLSINEIKKHMQNRNIDEYEQIMSNQLKKVDDEIQRLHNIKLRLSRRIESLDMIRNLPPLDHVTILTHNKRRVLNYKTQITKQSDWEFLLADLQNKFKLPPSLFIGDLGFYVDMNQIKSRGPEEFSGMFFIADDPFFDSVHAVTHLPAGKWLTLYIKGDHSEARKHYQKLLDYGKTHNLLFGQLVLERTVIDHYLSSDPELYITEIQIQIIDN